MKLLAVLATLPIALATSASAAEPATVGWWYMPQMLPSALPVAVPAPPYVPAGDLLVESTPQGPNALAAVRLFVPDGRRALTLALTVQSTRGTPDLAVCPTLSQWGAELVGVWSRHPTCGGPITPLTLGTGGRTLTAPATALVRDGVVDVLVLPRVDLATGSSSTFSTTLLPPTAAALLTVPEAAPTSPPAAPQPVAALPQQLPVTPVTVPLAPAAAPVGVSGPIVPAPPNAALPVPPVVAPPRPAEAVARTSAPTSDRSRLLALLALVSTALLGGFLLRRRGTPDEQRGVGRFRTARTGTPPIRL
jgi:hypothetical protein